MTSTAVNDVSIVLQTAKTGADSTVQASKDGGFQAVFDRQTSRNQPEEAATAQTEKAKSPVKETMQSKDTATPKKAADSKDTEKAASSEEQEKELEAVDGEAVEKVMEILQAATAELITQIAQTFGISEEEVTQLMSGMELRPLDLLQPEKLSQLLLTAAGAEDSMALLTDEELYGSFQTIMNAQSDILTAGTQALQTDMEQLQQLITEVENSVAASTPAEAVQVTEEEHMPFVEVTVSAEADLEMPDKELKTDNRPIAENDAGNVQTEVPDEVQKTSRDGKPSGNDTAGQHQNGNILLQQLKEDAFKPQIAQVSEGGFAGDMETQDIMRQIMDYMKVQIKPDMSNLEMQLHPASLGTLQVQVSSKGGVVTAQFVTQNEAVKAALESQMVQLKESFAEQGVKVEAIEVTVQTHQFEQNLEQGRGGNQEAPERRSRTRRIRLDGAQLTDGMDELNDEEYLAAQIMSANGGTVDYTA